MVAITTHPALLSLVATIFSLGGFLLLWWSVVVPRLPLVLLAGSLIIGQALRLPLFGQGGGLLISDIAVTLTLLAALATCIAKRPSSNELSSSFLLVWMILVGVFAVWSGISLLAGSISLNLLPTATSIASLYWLRLLAHLLLLPALLVLCHHNHRFSVRLFTITTFLLMIFGVLQFLIISDLSPLTASGWDPHQWRLTSTWLDPNFFAAYIFIAIPLAVHYVSKRSFKVLLLVVGFIALFLTQSRSGLLAVVIASLATTLLYFLRMKPSWRYQSLLLPSLIALATLCLVGAVMLWPRFVSLLGEDPTATLRYEALIVAQERLLPLYGYIGSGYNTYQFAATDIGLGSSALQHSRAGTDNS